MKNLWNRYKETNASHVKSFTKSYHISCAKRKVHSVRCIVHAPSRCRPRSNIVCLDSQRRPKCNFRANSGTDPNSARATRRRCKLWLTRNQVCEWSSLMTLGRFRKRTKISYGHFTQFRNKFNIVTISHLIIELYMQLYQYEAQRITFLVIKNISAIFYNK